MRTRPSCKVSSTPQTSLRNAFINNSFSNSQYSTRVKTLMRTSHRHLSNIYRTLAQLRETTSVLQSQTKSVKLRKRIAAVLRTKTKSVRKPKAVHSTWMRPVRMKADWSRSITWLSYSILKKMYRIRQKKFKHL